jgi:hypothetical protein
MKNFTFTLIALSLLLFASCSDESPTPINTNNDKIEEVDLSNLEKLAQTWTLEETYRDGVIQTSDGKDEYLFSEDGAFFFKSNNNWSAIGSYEFTGSDSTSISVLLTGINTPMIMDLKILDEKTLDTEFVSGGKTLLYHYVR